MARRTTESNRTNLTLVITPDTLDVGQMIQVSAVFTDKNAQPVFVDEIFMQILDSKGRVAWPLSVMERGASGFSKLISTRELERNTRYTIRVSDNSELVNHRFGFFKTNKRKLPLILLPITLAPFLIVPLVPKKAQIPFYYQYTTELDSKVCSVCSPHNGKKFKPNDPDMIRIGPPELGGETHFRCRCHYNMFAEISPAHAKAISNFKIIRAIKAVQAIENIKSRQLTIKV